MTLDEFEKATVAQLRAKANECFDRANTTGPLDRPAHYAEARFYLDEIKRRDDERIAARDERHATVGFWLEVGVVVLILAEIAISIIGVVIGVREGKEQAAVLAGIELGIQRQLALDSEALVDITHNAVDDKILIRNAGRTSITVWGTKLENRAPAMIPAQTVVPNGYYRIPTAALGEELSRRLPLKGSTTVPFVVYLRNDHGVDYVATATFAVTRTASAGFDVVARSDGAYQEKWSAAIQTAR